VQELVDRFLYLRVSLLGAPRLILDGPKRAIDREKVGLVSATLTTVGSSSSRLTRGGLLIGSAGNRHETWTVSS
jgi:hypothetical protein